MGAREREREGGRQYKRRLLNKTRDGRLGRYAGVYSICSDTQADRLHMHALNNS